MATATSLAGIDLHPLADMPDDYMRALIIGPQGAGKSTLAASIAQAGPTLYIDLKGEHGLRSFRGAPWEKNITIARPESVTQMDDLLWALESGDHPYTGVVIDSITAFQKMVLRYLLGHSETTVKEITKGSSPAKIQTWGQALDIMTDLGTFWNALAEGGRSHPMHVVMTAQTRITEDEEGRTRHNPDVQKGAQSIVAAAPDYILFCDVEHDTDDSGDPVSRHIVRFGASTQYRTKARVPVNLRGKIPSVLGRSKPLTLCTLGSLLNVGGMPAKK